MCLAHVGYYAEVGFGDVDEVANFSRVVCPHLNYSQFVVGVELQKRLWHSDVVVEVALSVKNVILLLQHGSNQFFCRSLAVCSGYANDWRAELAAMVACQLL